MPLGNGFTPGYVTSLCEIRPRAEPVTHRGFELSPDIIERCSWCSPNDTVPRPIACLDVPVARVFIMTSRVARDGIWPAFVPQNAKRHFRPSLVRLFASSRSLE